MDASPLDGSGHNMILEPAKSKSERATAALGKESIRAFKAFLRRKSYPCLGAKSALTRHTLQFFCADDICHETHDLQIAQRVQVFASEAQDDDVFLSMAILFPGSPLLSEVEFEQALWERLGGMHLIDRVDYGWDASISDDPTSRNFSMSIGGKGFFVIGLHPGASRLARRFQCPVMVFNLHRQFENLRVDGRYEKLRRSIISRDISFSGSSNPMLASFGQRSEARQYSGRVVEENWVCPFSSTVLTDKETIE